MPESPAASAPVRLCCGQRHFGALCPDGTVMCCLCFGKFSPVNLSKKRDGQLTDVCVYCAEMERKAAEAGR